MSGVELKHYSSSQVYCNDQGVTNSGFEHGEGRDHTTYDIVEHVQVFNKFFYYFV